MGNRRTVTDILPGAVVSSTGHRTTEIRSGDDLLVIPPFLRRSMTPDETAAWETRRSEIGRVQASARAGAANTASVAAAESRLRVAQNLEPEGKRLLAERETEGAVRGGNTLRSVCADLSRGREHRVRKRDAKRWCEAAGVALPRRFDDAHAARVRGAVLAALGPPPPQGTPRAGGKPVEPSGASRGVRRGR